MLLHAPSLGISTYLEHKMLFLHECIGNSNAILPMITVAGVPPLHSDAIEAERRRSPAAGSRSDVGAEAGGGQVQCLVRARRGASVSGRLVLPWLVRPTASSLWLCCTAQHAYPHRRDSYQPPGRWPAWATGTEPTHSGASCVTPIACWTPPGSWPNPIR